MKYFPGGKELNSNNNLLIALCMFHLFSEYIVTYNGYYKQITRKRYLNAALHESGVTSWKIVQRDNPAFDYPSDFDVVKVRQDSNV